MPFPETKSGLVTVTPLESTNSKSLASTPVTVSLKRTLNDTALELVSGVKGLPRPMITTVAGAVSMFNSGARFAPKPRLPEISA